jgi:GNAT superfamily N-acetyltransferase
MSKSNKSVFIVKFYDRATDFTSTIRASIQINLKEESKQDIEYISRLASAEEVIENLYYASYTFVYRVDDDIVGFATLDAHGCIKNLYVFAKYRRNGYGRDIVDYIISIGKKKHHTNCYAKIRVTNIPSKQLFETLSFKLDSQNDNVLTYRKNIVEHNPSYYFWICVNIVKKAIKKFVGWLINK